MPLLVATDLDGTLLDDETYAFDDAREALSALRERRAILVLCSSKTRAEMEPLARTLGLTAPLVVENGGALVIPRDHLRGAPAGARDDGAAWVLALGARRPALVRTLGAIAAEAGARVVGFASLSPEDVARLTGLPVPAARLALAREYDEPFLLDPPGAEAAVTEAARRRGLAVTRGGRFFHLTGPTDKGRALRALLDLHAAEGRAFTTVGLGDSANDLPLLEVVDRAVVVPRPGGGLDPTLAARLPRAERAPAPGPAGWNAAVLTILGEGRLPAVAAP
ncbi:MAG: HAD-IIB family hydrolase [Acidobacteria bacterium]|nr:HAD-IIB family hydrolase [Acidobacteriota bacterium]